MGYLCENKIKYKLLIIRGAVWKCLCLDYFGLSAVASAYGTIWERMLPDLMIGVYELLEAVLPRCIWIPVDGTFIV